MRGNGSRNGARTITQDGRLMLAKAERDGVETVWDRFEAQQPACGFCETGLSCRICAMGPCRIDPFGEGPQRDRLSIWAKETHRIGKRAEFTRAATVHLCRQGRQLLAQPRALPRPDQWLKHHHRR